MGVVGRVIDVENGYLEGGSTAWGKEWNGRCLWALSDSVQCRWPDISKRSHQYLYQSIPISGINHASPFELPSLRPLHTFLCTYFDTVERRSIYDGQYNHS